VGCIDPADTDTNRTSMQPSTHQTAPGARLAGLPTLVGLVGAARPDTSRWILTSLGALLLGLIICQARGPAGTQPVLHPARTRGTASHGGGVGRWPARPGGLGP
jgi:hypothetical protein